MLIHIFAILNKLARKWSWRMRLYNIVDPAVSILIFLLVLIECIDWWFAIIYFHRSTDFSAYLIIVFWFLHNYERTIFLATSYHFLYTAYINFVQCVVLPFIQTILCAKHCEIGAVTDYLRVVLLYHWYLWRVSGYFKQLALLRFYYYVYAAVQLLHILKQRQLWAIL